MPQKTPEEIIRESGNSFQCKVATRFRDAGWNVTFSPYYVDNATDKARELDLVCERIYQFQDPYFGSMEYRIQLYVECKYINQPVVFWFDDRNDKMTEGWVHRSTPFKRNNVYRFEHHYLKTEKVVAKLFSSGKGEESDPIYKAVAQCLGGLIHHRGQIPPPPTLGKAFVRYPVIVHSGGPYFHRTGVSPGDGPATLLDSNFMLEVNYAFREPGGDSKREYFLIDVVSVNSLDGFFRSLEHEVENAWQLMGR
jgi:hypothetical protein